MVARYMVNVVVAIIVQIPQGHALRDPGESDRTRRADVGVDEREGLPMNRFAMSRRTVVGAIGASAVIGFARNALAAPKTLADVKKAGVLQVGCEAAYVPFTYRDKTAAIVGFDVEIVTAYLRPIGVRPEFIDTQWSGVIPALYAGRFDMVPTMSYTKERLERVLFSIPYADASQALLIRAPDKDKISTISDMSNRVLGVKLGSKTGSPTSSRPTAALLSRM
jgi:polar amino acid transport system substrate-binding protein